MDIEFLVKIIGELSNSIDTDFVKEFDTISGYQ